jgi:hypothetical protein
VNGFPAQLEAVMLKRLILLIGVFLGSHVITAQTPAPEFVSAQELVAPIVTAAPTSSLAASVLLPEDLGKSAARFGHLFAGTYERDQSLKGLDRLSPMHEVKTLFLTQSLLPLVQLWGGRLRLDGFTSTLHMQNAQLGPSAGGGLQDFRLPGQSYPEGPRSLDLYGISLSFHFGQDAQIGRPTKIWRCLAQIAGTAR